MDIYLANKMQGIPYFNAPWFDESAAKLRALPGVKDVFNPVEHDRNIGFEPMSCPTGELEEAYQHGFSLKDALVADWTWIGTKADCVVLGPDWWNSKGAISEAACIQALRKPAFEFDVFLEHYANDDILLRWAIPPIMELGGPVVVAGDGLTDGHRGVGWV
jgi:hypothetical protein